MAAEPPSSPSTPSLPPLTLPLPLLSLTLTASPQPLTVSVRIIDAMSDHSPSPNPNYEYILDSDHIVYYVPVDHVDGLMSDPVDDLLIDLNTGDQHVAADVAGRWKQIRVDDVVSAARKLPSLQLALGQH